MKENKLTVLSLVLILMCLGLSCKFLGSSRISENSNSNLTAQNNNTFNSPTVSKVECPTATLSVNELRNTGLDKYEGCILSVQGKLWDVRNDSVELLDTSERAAYNNTLFCFGNFSSNTYYEVGRKLSDIKINQQFERLPVATFTGSVKKSGGYAGLSGCVLTNFQKQ